MIDLENYVIEIIQYNNVVISLNSCFH